MKILVAVAVAFGLLLAVVVFFIACSSSPERLGREECEFVGKEIVVAGECCFFADKAACEAHAKIAEARGMPEVSACMAFGVDATLFADKCSP